MKIYEGFFVRLSFHLIHQSRLKVRANNQFEFVDNDAQHTRGPFPNHSFLFLLHCLDYSVSQATACDGLLYQVTPEDDINIPGPGVLPI